MKIRKFEDLVVYEDDDYFGISKPAGISSLHEHIGRAPSIIELAKKHAESIQLCHRLDKETSGVLLLSKHNDAYKHAAKAFERRKVKKTYHAVACGQHSFSNLELTLPLHTTRSGRASVNASKGKLSTTVLDTIEHFGHFTLVACQPVTGRLHQIRIHLASQNAAIAADTIYGGKEPFLSHIKKKFSLGKYEEEKPMIGRFALHAHSLVFTSMNEEELSIKAPYPKDFAVFLKLLRKYDKTNN